ncbi:centrosomal protein of 164 kDa-like [Watersipora subatra]|uniref:centrosomal protein of 164 kDa-like n=1 Tax=Watersipora subatra TaxID=2589382 RepID=UPI00355B62E6
MSEQLILEEQYDENYEPSEEEIVEYALLIGIDPDKEPHLMYIAKEGINAPLPKDWKPCQDTNGDIYYFNFSSGASIWEHPCDDYYKKMVTEARHKKEVEPSPASNAVSAPPNNKKKKKADGKKKKSSAEPASSLAPLKASGTLSPVGAGLAPLKSLGGMPPSHISTTSLLGAPSALKGSMPLMSRTNESFGNVQMLSMSASEEDTTNVDGTSSINLQGASNEFDSSALEGYTASATANKTDTLDNTTDLVKLGVMDIDMLDATIPVGASTDLDVRESYDSYQSTPRVDPSKPISRFLKSNKPKPEPLGLVTAAALRSKPPAAPVVKSVDESSELETSELATDRSSPLKKDLFADLNLAESLDEHPQLLEGSESERAGFLEPTETDDDKRQRASAIAAEKRAAEEANEAELSSLRARLHSERENAKLELLEENDEQLKRLKAELDTDQKSKESQLREEHESTLSALRKDKEGRLAMEKEEIEKKYRRELEEYREQLEGQKEKEMADIRKNSESRLSELRDSLEDMNGLKEKELASAQEKVRDEIKADLEKQKQEERRKLEQDYSRQSEQVRNELEAEAQEREKQLRAEFKEKEEEQRQRMNADHQKAMDTLQKKIDELQEVEKRQKEGELRSAEAAQRDIGKLETDLQELLEERKSQIKEQQEDELQRYKRELSSATQFKRAELTTLDTTERSRMEREHEETVATTRREFEKRLDSMRKDHNERMARLRMSIEEKEQDLEGRSRRMEERKRELDEDQLTLENLSEDLVKRKDALKKQEREVKRDETLAEGAEKENEALLEELSVLRQTATDQQSEVEKLRVERRQLEEKLKASNKQGKEQGKELERLKKQVKSQIHNKHRTTAVSDKENYPDEDSHLSLEDLASDDTSPERKPDKRRSMDDSPVFFQRRSERSRIGYGSLDDTSGSSDYSMVKGKTSRRMINSENAVQIAKRYLRKHAKSLKDAGDAWTETKRRLNTSSTRYRPLTTKYFSETDSDSEVTDLAELDTSELQMRINQRMDSLISPNKEILPGASSHLPSPSPLPSHTPLTQLQNLSTYGASVMLQQATQTSPLTQPQTTQTLPGTKPKLVQTEHIPPPVQHSSAIYTPTISGSVPNLSYSNPYVERPKGDYVWGTMYDHAERVLERKWRTYFGTGASLSSSGLRRSPYNPTSSQLPHSKATDFRSSLGSLRPTAVDINGKLSEQKRWVEEFSKSVPHRTTSGQY